MLMEFLDTREPFSPCFSWLGCVIRPENRPLNWRIIGRSISFSEQFGEPPETFVGLERPRVQPVIERRSADSRSVGSFVDAQAAAECETEKQHRLAVASRWSAASVFRFRLWHGVAPLHDLREHRMVVIGLHEHPPSILCFYGPYELSHSVGIIDGYTFGSTVTLGPAHVAALAEANDLTFYHFARALRDRSADCAIILCWFDRPCRRGFGFGRTRFRRPFESVPPCQVIHGSILIPE